MSYQIKSGDTLSRIAQRHNTTVDALMKANTGIKDANKIFTGNTLNIPGSRDEFVPGGSNNPAQSPQLTGGTQGPTTGAQGPTTAGGPQATGGAQGPRGNPYDIAMQNMGKNAGSLKLEGSGVGADMEDWVPNNVNCANFVSACLEQAGMIDNSQHHNAVVGLMANLDKDPNFKRVSIENAKPGDVVSMQTPGGGHHVVMFAGMKDGRPQFIGSNNVNSDGSQRISLTSMNYPILAVHQYQG